MMMKHTKTTDTRLSKYASVLPLNDNFLLVFSAMTDDFIVCNKSLLTAQPDGSVLIGSNRLADQLKEAKALKDPDRDEADILRELIDEIDGNDEIFQLHVNPTLNCNFRCWYCYEEHQAQSKMNENTLESVINFARSKIEAGKPLKAFSLSFFGGEPLMYYNQIAGKLIREIKSLCDARGIPFSTHFTTNAFLMNEAIATTLKDVKASFQITLDGAKDFHDKVRFSANGTGSYHKILDNAKLLAKDNHSVLLRINYTSDNIGSIPTIIDDLNSFDPEIRQYIRIDFQRVWQDRPNITEAEILELISSFAKRLNESGYGCSYMSNVGPSHVRNSCYGDKRSHILVNYDGNLFFCTARDFKPENSAGRLNSDGTIAWNQAKYDSYYSCKFTRKACRDCRIAPLCGGGCRQRASESAHTAGCIYNYSQADIDRMILNRFSMRHL